MSPATTRRTSRSRVRRSYARRRRTSPRGCTTCSPRARQGTTRTHPRSPRHRRITDRGRCSATRIRTTRRRTSYRSQITSVFKHPRKKDLYIALADRWLPGLPSAGGEDFRSGRMAHRIASSSAQRNDPDGQFGNTHELTTRGHGHSRTVPDDRDGDDRHVHRRERLAPDPLRPRHRLRGLARRVADRRLRVAGALTEPVATASSARAWAMPDRLSVWQDERGLATG